MPVPSVTCQNWSIGKSVDGFPSLKLRLFSKRWKWWRSPETPSAARRGSLWPWAWTVVGWVSGGCVPYEDCESCMCQPWHLENEIHSGEFFVATRKQSTNLTQPNNEIDKFLLTGYKWGLEGQEPEKKERCFNESVCGDNFIKKPTHTHTHTYTPARLFCCR